MIIGVWAVSLANAAVVCLSGMASFEFFPGRFIRLPAFSDKTIGRIINIFGQIMFVIFPITITGFCYWRVYKVVRGHNATVSSTRHAGPAGNTSLLTKEEIHITKSVLALVCGFVLCWFPCSAVSVLALYISLPRHAEMVFTYTAYTSNVINPILFNIFNKPFRNQFVQVVFPRK
jgi:melatonin receptor type 1B